MSHDKESKSAPGTMGYVDAHIHLADPGYAGKVEEIVQDAVQHNVSQMLSNATDYESSLETIRLARQFPHRILAAVGIHPLTVLQSENLHLEGFWKMSDENSEWITAIGEIGLDGKYSREEHAKARQNEIFRSLLGLAERKNMPVVVHSRQAVPEVIASLADFRLRRVLLHWYDGPIENLPLFKERGYLISFGPAVLYSRRITEIVRAVDSDLILTETDGPVQYRGLFEDQLTKPWFVVQVVQKLAEIRGVTPDTMRSTILSNMQRLLRS
jgi:TatD DNase family protein